MAHQQVVVKDQAHSLVEDVCPARLAAGDCILESPVEGGQLELE